MDKECGEAQKMYVRENVRLCLSACFFKGACLEEKRECTDARMMEKKKKKSKCEGGGSLLK